MPVAPVANYFVEQGRGVFRKGGIVPKPPFGSPEMFEYLIIVGYAKLSHAPPFWNLGRKSGQKNGLNLTMT